MSFHLASDGPRLVLFGPLDLDLAALGAFLRSLAREGRTADLESQEFISTRACVQLFARCIGSTQQSERAPLRRGLVKLGDVPLRFEWNQSSDDWTCAADLVDELARSSGPGHQFLTNHPGDDAIVVVSKGEYGDDVLSR